MGELPPESPWQAHSDRALDLVRKLRFTGEMSTEQDVDHTTAREQDSWIAVLAVRYPEGTVCHPGVLDRVDRELGRFCLINLAYDEGVQLTFGSDVPGRKEAMADVVGVVQHILHLLGLGPDSVVQFKLTKPHDTPSDYVRRDLRVVGK